jgi:hypothetical protein
MRLMERGRGCSVRDGAKGDGLPEAGNANSVLGVATGAGANGRGEQKTTARVVESVVAHGAKMQSEPEMSGWSLFQVHFLYVVYARNAVEARGEAG